MIYLDNSATTLQKPPEVMQALTRAMQHLTTPGRGGHQAAMAAAEAVFDCRRTAAELFCCDPTQVVFTMNATHGLNLAIFSLVKPGAKVVVSGFAHNAVMRPLYALGAKIRLVGTRLFAPERMLEQLERAATPNTAAVICTHISNVYGDILPLAQAAEICKSRHIPLIVDAAQSAGVLPIDFAALDAAFVAMPGHKALYGPQGTGILLCKDAPKPLIYGGTGGDSLSHTMPVDLPDCAEAGTCNTAGICGLAAGMEFVKNRPEIRTHETLLARRLCSGLMQMERVEVFTGAKQAGVVSFRTPLMDCEALARQLDAHKIAVRAGLHCAPQAHRCGGTLQTGTVRVSFGFFNTEAEVDALLTALQEILAEKRKKA